MYLLGICKAVLGAERGASRQTREGIYGRRKRTGHEISRSRVRTHGAGVGEREHSARMGGEELEARFMRDATTSAKYHRMGSKKFKQFALVWADKPESMSRRRERLVTSVKALILSRSRGMVLGW